MNDEVEALWNLYEEHCSWERHHEEMRASATNVLLAIAAAVIALVTYDQDVGMGDLPLTIFLILQGGYGALFSMKHYERFRMHKARADGYRSALDARLPAAQLLLIRGAADKANETAFPVMHRVRLNWFWTGIHWLVALGGAGLTACAVL